MPRGVWKRTEEIKKKTSETMKGKMPKFIPNNKGVVRTEDTKKRISETLKSKGIKPPNRKGVIFENALCRMPGYRAFYEKRRETRKKTNGGSHTWEQWQELKRKYDNRCVCCGVSESETQITIDHVVPISKGGGDEIENIQPLCLNCNMKKGNRSSVDYRGTRC